MPGSPDELAAQKRSLRRLLVERREAWLSQTSEDERAACVASIWSQVEYSEAFRSARTILLYASLPDELPTEAVLKRWSHPTVPDSVSRVLPDSVSRVLPDPASHVMPDSIGHPLEAKTLVLPLVEGECLRLKAYRPDGVQPGYQGILEPLPSCPDVAPESIDLAIVPGRAFTADGWRMGRGKGFYDRLLPTLVRARKIGVAYPYQMVEQLPLAPWDIRLDAVYF